jgi:hypothetical protein
MPASRGPRRAVLLALAASISAAALASWLVFSDRVSERELAAKAELTRLGALVVMDAQRKHVASVNLSTIQSPERLGRAMELLPALTHIESLHLDGTRFGDGDAGVVGRLASLQDLVLNQTAITDTGLEKLAGLSRLKTIHLVDTPVTNAGLQSLGHLRALAVIDLSGTKVTGGFEPLAQLPELTWLVAQRLSLDAAAIAALGECPSLSRLRLRGSTCPPEAIDELMRKKPGLTIDQ